MRCRDRVRGMPMVDERGRNLVRDRSSQRSPVAGKMRLESRKNRVRIEDVRTFPNGFGVESVSSDVPQAAGRPRRETARSSRFFHFCASPARNTKLRAPERSIENVMHKPRLPFAPISLMHNDLKDPIGSSLRRTRLPF